MSRCMLIRWMVTLRNRTGVVNWKVMYYSLRCFSVSPHELNPNKLSMINRFNESNPGEFLTRVTCLPNLSFSWLSCLFYMFKLYLWRKSLLTDNRSSSGSGQSWGPAHWEHRDKRIQWPQMWRTLPYLKQERRSHCCWRRGFVLSAFVIRQ